MRFCFDFTHFTLYFTDLGDDLGDLCSNLQNLVFPPLAPMTAFNLSGILLINAAMSC